MTGNYRPFYDFLREHRNGFTHDDLSDALQELVAAVTETEKGGKLTFTVTIKPNKSGALEVSDDVKLTLPKENRGASIFFASPDNNLVRQDPRQQQLPLQSIGGKPEVREIGPSSSTTKAIAS